MNILGYEFFSKTKAKTNFVATEHTQESVNNFAKQSGGRTAFTINQKSTYSSPFVKIGKGNLSLPFISKYYTNRNIVMFGADNAYPQIVNQIYHTSGLLKAIIKFTTNAVIGGGYEWENVVTGLEKKNIDVFERKNQFKKLVRELTRDYILHERICVKICQEAKTIGGKEVWVFKSMHRFDPADIRNDSMLCEFAYSEDWLQHNAQKIYVKYSDNCKEKESLFVYQANSAGQSVYPIPTVNSILNLGYLDGEIAYFMKSNMNNSVFPSIILRVPKTLTDEAYEDLIENVRYNKGADGAGDILVLEGDGFDDTPEFIPVPVNNNDKLFLETVDIINDKMCQSFMINPSIMGIGIKGQLGATTQIQDAYTIFEKNTVMPLREEVTEFINELAYIAGINHKLVINNYQIVEKAIVNNTEDETFELVKKKK